MAQLDQLDQQDHKACLGLKVNLVSEDHQDLLERLVYRARRARSANPASLETLDKRAKRDDEEEEDQKATEEKWE